jgi:hypothetical protein
MHVIVHDWDSSTLGLVIVSNTEAQTQRLEAETQSTVASHLISPAFIDLRTPKPFQFKNQQHATIQIFTPNTS